MLAGANPGLENRWYQGWYGDRHLSSAPKQDNVYKYIRYSMGRSFNGQDNSLQNYLLRFKSSPTCQDALGACYALVDKLAKLVAFQAADAGSIPAESTNKLFSRQPRGQVYVSRAVTESEEGASRTLDSERLLKIYASLAQLVRASGC